MILYDHECSCGTLFEAFAHIENIESQCPQCGLMAKRVISPVRVRLEGVSGHFPTATQKWIKMHETEGKAKAE